MTAQVIGSTVELTVVEETVRQRLHEFGRRFDGDVDAFVELYTPDAMHCAPTREVYRGRGALRGFVEELHAVGCRDLSLEMQDLDVSGDLVVDIGRYQWQAPGPDGQVRTDRGKYLNTWHRGSDGQYRIHRQIWHSDLPPGA
jgi:ketosteroid isomerase-like protein